MRPSGHALTSAVSAGVVGAATQSPAAALACFVFGVLMDIDHAIDYVLFKGFTWDYQKFARAMYKLELPRFILIFHSYELILLYWAWVLLGNAGSIAVGAGVGISVHLAMDTYFNRHPTGSYFIIYRALHGFKTSAFFVTARQKK